jgi:hypothetical protein
LLERGYAVVSKDYSVRRTYQLVTHVTEWVADEAHPNRQIGWVPIESTDYVRPVRRLAVRSKSVPKASGTTPCCCLLAFPIRISWP